MKKFKIFMTALIAAVTFAGMSSISAAAGTVAGSTATPHTFTIKKTINNAANVVTGKTFTYTVAADASNPSGGVTSAPTTATITFTDVSPTGGTAVATTKLDFGPAVFSKNGDYKFTVTETASNDPTNYPVDTSNKYTIIASVRNASSSNLSSDEGKQVHFFAYTGLTPDASNKINNDATTGDAILNFSVNPQYKHIEISKKVSGAMADVDKDWTFTVTIDGTGTYNVSGNTNTQVTTITAGTPATLTVKHNGTIIIGSNNGTDQIPIGATYDFAETTDNDYTTTINGTAGSSKDDQTVSATQSENEWAVLNTFEGSTVTGVFLKILPYIVIVAIAVAGIIYLIVRNKKQKEAEE